MHSRDGSVEISLMIRTRCCSNIVNKLKFEHSDNNVIK